MRKILHILGLLICCVVILHANNLAYNEYGKVVATWALGDKFGIYTSSGSRIFFGIKEIDSESKHNAVLDGYGWKTVANATYYGYYPYNTNYVQNGNVMTALPVSYTGQTQTENNNLDHLAAYDYMVAQTTTTETEANFTFAHYGSIIRFACYVPTGKTFNALEISSKTGEDLFTSAANVNLPNQTITSTSKNNKATLTLNDITVEAGDSLVAYMMLPPTELSGKAIMISLNATDGSALQTYIAGVNIQAGKVYPVSVGKENYFKVSAANNNANNNQQILSLQADFEENDVTDTQITTATAYAPDFTLDTVNKFKPFLLGDVNFDGTVDVTDVVIVVNHYQNNSTDELDMNVSDINGDGMIDVTDVVGIVNIYQQGK